MFLRGGPIEMLWGESRSECRSRVAASTCRNEKQQIGSSQGAFDLLMSPIPPTRRNSSLLAHVPDSTGDVGTSTTTKRLNLPS